MIWFLSLLVLEASSNEIYVFNMSKFQESIIKRGYVDNNKNMTCEKALVKAMSGRIYAMDKVELNKVTSRLCKMPTMNGHLPCLLDQSQFCNGFSSCLTDECECAGSSVFYCGDNSGCISIDQVCDGIKDCLDGSDECVCADYVNCLSETFNQGICLNADKRQCPMANKTNKATSEVLVSNKCFPIHRLTEGTLPFNDTEGCLIKCPNYTHHCVRVVWDNEDCNKNTIVCSPDEFWYYDCNKRSSNTSVKSLTRTRIMLTEVCDSKPDCWNGADEEDCFNRFKCKDDSRSIHLSRKCDLVNDCNDGSDECANCTVSLMYSEKHLIGTPFLR